MTPEQQSLVADNYKMAHWAARKYPIAGVEYDDRVQIAAMGLCKAALTFDPERGQKFITYGSVIMRNELLMAYRSSKRRRNEVSLNALDVKGEDGSVAPRIDFLASPEDMESRVAARCELQDIAARAAVLKPMERSLIAMRMRGLPQKDCAAALGISQSYASRILTRVLGKSRKVGVACGE